jgi:DNA transformation protein
MAVSASYLQYIQDQLVVFGEYETKKMFGGIGFFREGAMFAMIGKDALRLKVDDTNKADFEAHGMVAFMSDSMKKGMPYFEVPTQVVEDADELAKWCEKSFAIAMASKKK